MKPTANARIKYAQGANEIWVLAQIANHGGGWYPRGVLSTPIGNAIERLVKRGAIRYDAGRTLYVRVYPTTKPAPFGGICNDGELADRISEAAHRVAGLTDRTTLTRRARTLWRIGTDLADLAERLDP